MKIITRKELHKGYIPWDKLHYKQIAFESYGLGNMFNSEDLKKIMFIYNIVIADDLYSSMSLADFRKQLKKDILNTEKVKEIIKKGYHTHIYLNFNREGIDAFISR